MEVSAWLRLCDGNCASNVEEESTNFAIVVSRKKFMPGNFF